MQVEKTDDFLYLLVDAAGKVVSRDRPLLLADDLGVLRGDGLFESFLVVDGEPQSQGWPGWLSASLSPAAPNAMA